MTLTIQDKVAVVTGGASGIGKATVLALARAGATVVIADINLAGAQAAVAEDPQLQSRIVAFELDLCSEESIAGFSEAVLGRYGRVDILVNSAGYTAIEPFMQNDPASWRRTVDINLMGAIRLTQALLGPMIEAKAGKIINVASDAGRVGSSGETVYAAAKGGLIAFTKSLARELARSQINVNCVCPGPTDTPMLRQQSSERVEALTRAIPFRRLARPDDLGQAVLFFASPASDYITAQVLSVSGGLTMAG